MIIKSSVIILVLISVFNESCSQKTDRDRIIETTNKVIKILKNGDKYDFEKLNIYEIENKNKTQEMVYSDYEICKKNIKDDFYKRSTKYEISDSLDEIGRLKVTIPLINYPDSLNVKLNIFFGPPQFVPLNQLSGYNIETNYKKTPALSPVLPFKNNK